MRHYAFQKNDHPDVNNCLAIIQAQVESMPELSDVLFVGWYYEDEHIHIDTLDAMTRDQVTEVRIAIANFECIEHIEKGKQYEL